MSQPVVSLVELGCGGAVSHSLMEPAASCKVKEIYLIDCILIRCSIIQFQQKSMSLTLLTLRSKKETKPVFE